MTRHTGALIDDDRPIRARRGLRSPILAIGALAFALAGGGVVVQVAGLPAPAVGTIGEDGPATEAVLNNAEDIAVAPNGDIYIADRNSSRLLRIRDGILTVAHRVGDFDAEERDFSGVTVADDGTVYFTNGLAVMALDPDGAVRELVALPEPGQANGPKLAAEPGGVILAGGRIPRLERIGDDGTSFVLSGADEVATEAGVGDGGPAELARFASISDIAVDSRGVIYVADEGFGDVRAITPDGAISTVFGAGTVPVNEASDGTPAADVEYGSAEIGIAVDGSDRLYVVPRLAGKVFVVDGGAITTLVGGGPNPGAGSAPLDTQLQAPFRIALTNDDDLLILIEDGRFLLLAPGATVGTLVASVPSPSEINLDPVVVVASVALAAGMLFLVPFPAEIFNNTLVEHHDQIRSWFRPRRATSETSAWGKWWALILGLVGMALLYGFLDPGFGLDAESVPTFLGLLAGVLVTTVGFAVPTMVMRRGKTGEPGHLRVLPVAVLVGVACVIISRLIGFLPGYLYGIALGLVFARAVSEDAETREVAVTSIVLLAIAIAAWFGLGVVRSTGTGAGVVEATLAMISVSAFEALVFGLLPIHGMPGRVLFRGTRVLWAVIWGVSVLVFFHVLINPQSGYLVNTALVPVATTYGLLAGFTLVSLALWAWFRHADQSRDDRLLEQSPGA